MDMKRAGKPREPPLDRNDTNGEKQEGGEYGNGEASVTSIKATADGEERARRM